MCQNLRRHQDHARGGDQSDQEDQLQQGPECRNISRETHFRIVHTSAHADWRFRNKLEAKPRVIMVTVFSSSRRIGSVMEKGSQRSNVLRHSFAGGIRTMLDVEPIVAMSTSCSSAWRVGSHMTRTSVAKVHRHTMIPKTVSCTGTQKSDTRECNSQARKEWISETQSNNRCNKCTRGGSFSQVRMIRSDPHNSKPIRSQMRGGDSFSEQSPCPRHRATFRAFIRHPSAAFLPHS